MRSLSAQGHSLREISRLLALSRNTVRRILRQPMGEVAEVLPCDEATLVRLKAAFSRARGNAVRVRELLAQDGLDLSYSTLTRWIRHTDLRAPPKRVGEYELTPGQEMQHDTSPHRVSFGQADKPVTVQCAGLVLAYSRRLFIQYYPRFTRFEARAFLLEAVRFMAGVCPVCIIDNTSVLLAAGAGADAVIAPEISAPSPALWASGSAPTGSETQNAKVGSRDRSPMLKTISSLAAASQISTTSTARHSTGAATSPTASRSMHSVCRLMRPIL